MKHWIDKTVTLSDCWGPAAKTILAAPDGGAPTFRLRARDIGAGGGGRQTVQLVVEVKNGAIVDGWAGAIFTPMGKTPVTGLTGLPPWIPTVAETYRQAIEGGGTNLGQSGTLRLEGVVPFIGSDGNVIYDLVRLYFAENAVKSAELPHLVVVKTSILPGSGGPLQAKQDGNAQGPPK